MAKETSGNFEKKWAEIIKKASTDEVFKQRLMQNPSQVLKDYGVEILADKNVKIVENTTDVHYLVLPEASVGKTLSEDELRRIAGGTEKLGFRMVYKDVMVGMVY